VDDLKVAVRSIGTAGQGIAKEIIVNDDGIVFNQSADQRVRDKSRTSGYKDFFVLDHDSSQGFFDLFIEPFIVLDIHPHGKQQGLKGADE
jgi:hypothetical protein